MHSRDLLAFAGGALAFRVRRRRPWFVAFRALGESAPSLPRVAEAGPREGWGCRVKASGAARESQGSCQENPACRACMHSGEKSHPRDELLAGFATGETVTTAARRLGIPARPSARGKARHPASDGALWDAVRAGRGAVKLAPLDPDAPLPDRTELLRRLDAQSRDGSIRATELLLLELPAELGRGERSRCPRDIGHSAGAGARLVNAVSERSARAAAHRGRSARGRPRPRLRCRRSR